jgi:hypothetical protein
MEVSVSTKVHGCDVHYLQLYCCSANKSTITSQQAPRPSLNATTIIAPGTSSFSLPTTPNPHSTDHQERENNTAVTAALVCHNKLYSLLARKLENANMPPVRTCYAAFLSNDVILTRPSTVPAKRAAGTPLAPSVEKAYYRKCIQLKRRLNEVEAANEEARIRRVRLDRAIMKMRLERAFLLEQLSKRVEPNVEGSDASGEEGPGTVGS